MWSTSRLEAAGESRPHPPVHVPVGGERLSAHGALVGPLPGVHQHVAVQGAGRAQRLPADAAGVVGPTSVRVVLRKARITASLRRAGPNSATRRCEFRALYIHACINTHTHIYVSKSQQCFSAIFLLLFHFKCLPKCQNLSGPQTNKYFVHSSLSVSSIDEYFYRKAQNEGGVFAGLSQTHIIDEQTTKTNTGRKTQL